jgi:peptide/nickel transport system permease protein
VSAQAERVSFGAGLPTNAAARTWQRLKRDPLALAAGIVVLVILLLCFVGGPVAENLLGHGPNDQFTAATSNELKPVGPWKRVVDDEGHRALLVLGADGPLGRDEFLRLLAGGRTSLEIAFLATAIAVLVGTALGAVAGFYGGWVDTAIGRITEFVMGFPILFFVVVVGMTVNDRLNGITAHRTFAPGVIALVVLIGFFNWFYVARIVRSQVISLREQEFVEAARMVGAGTFYILRKHVLPHLVGSIVVYGSLVIATTMILEAALSILGLGIELPDASWGNMLSTNWGTLLVPGGQEAFAKTSAWTSVWPTAAIFVTVFAFALFGEGLRRAFDPHGRA